jgi:hypothetical protein
MGIGIRQQFNNEMTMRIVVLKGRVGSRDHRDDPFQ